MLVSAEDPDEVLATVPIVDTPVEKSGLWDKVKNLSSTIGGVQLGFAQGVTDGMSGALLEKYGGNSWEDMGKGAAGYLTQYALKQG